MSQIPSFSSLVRRFFTEHLDQQRGVSPRTISSYRDTFRLLLLFIENHIGKSPTNVALVDINADLVLAFLNHLEHDRKNTVRSRNARLTAVRCFLKYAAHHDLEALPIIERVLALPQKRSERPMVGFLSRQEMQAIIDAPDTETWAGQRDRTFFALLYNTGARISEALALQVADVHLDRSAYVMFRGKGRKKRTVPLWPSTANTVRSWKAQLGDVSGSSPLFPNRSGATMTRSNMTQRLAECVESLCATFPDLRTRHISPHTIRHTTAMHLLQSGVDITIIALWLGHENPATTHVYIESDLSMKERALNSLQPPHTKLPRFAPPNGLMQFLQSL
jgi:integrase/recombinase XerD